jgi:CheY-like chemotaxis protein
LIVAVSGYGQAEDRERSRIAGFDQHLLKPVAPERLLEIVRRPVPKASSL